MKNVQKHAWNLARDKWCPSCKNGGVCKTDCKTNYSSRYVLVREFIAGYMACYEENIKEK